jgi:hypothetical protein
MYHGNETDHHTKDCPIYIDTKRKMNQDTTQPSPQLHSREVNHSMQWAPRNQQHSSLYPSHYPAQTYQNSQTQPSAYYQSYHYATSNHPEPSLAPQMTYHSALPQITYPTPSNTNANQLKAELPHLRSKLKNLCNKPNTFQPTTPYSQSPVVQTQTLKPKGGEGITITKSIMSLSKVPLPRLNDPTCR